MAENFEDVVKKLGSTVKKPAASQVSAVLAVQMVDEKGKVIGEEEGAAAAEEKREEEKRGKKTNTLLGTIADALTGGSGKLSAADKKKGGLFAGIAAALGALGGGVGVGISAFMIGVGASVAFAGPFVIVMTALGAGLAAFALAVGGATWKVSTLMPDIAAGLKSFEDVDGKNLLSVGAGIGALGDGFASMGAGGAILGVGNLVGNIADGISGLFGGDADSKTALMADLKKFGEVKLDAAQIGINAKAMVAYGEAMAAAGKGTTWVAFGEAADAIIGGIGRLFGAVPPIDALIAFGAIKLNLANVKNNAKAMKEYAVAMSMGAIASGAKGIASLANFAGAAFDGLSKFVGGEGVFESQMKALKTMSAMGASINSDNVSKVTAAMVSYAVAMAVGAAGEFFRGAGSILNIATQSFDALSEKTTGGKGVIESQMDALKQMSDTGGSINSDNVTKVAAAMSSYATAMAVGAKGEFFRGAGSILNIVTQGFDALAKLIPGGVGGLDSQLNALQQMSDAAEFIDGENVAKVATAMSSYATAMAVGAKASSSTAAGSITNFVGEVFDALSELLPGGQGVLEKQLAGMKKMSEASDGINGVKVGLVASAMAAYGSAMAVGAKVSGDVSGKFSSFVGQIAESLFAWFGAGADPIEDLKKFASKTVTKQEVAAIKTNAEALETYARAMSKLSQMTSLKFGGAASARARGVGGSSMSDFAEDLLNSVPMIEMAIMGGTVTDKEGLWTGDYITKGLASANIQYAEAAKNIRMLRRALGAEVGIPLPIGTVPQGVNQAALQRLGVGHGDPAGRMMINAPTADNSSNVVTNITLGMGGAKYRVNRSGWISGGVSR